MRSSIRTFATNALATHTLASLTIVLATATLAPAQNAGQGFGGVAGAGRQGGLNVTSMARQIFTQADRNHNDQLSRTEFSTAQLLTSNTVANLGRMGIIGRGNSTLHRQLVSGQIGGAGGLAQGGMLAGAGGWMNQRITNSNHVTLPQFTGYFQNAVAQGDAAWRMLYASNRRSGGRAYPRYGRGYGRGGYRNYGYGNSMPMVVVEPAMRTHHHANSLATTGGVGGNSLGGNGAGPVTAPGSTAPRSTAPRSTAPNSTVQSVTVNRPIAGVVNAVPTNGGAPAATTGAAANGQNAAHSAKASASGGGSSLSNLSTAGLMDAYQKAHTPGGKPGNGTAGNGTATNNKIANGKAASRNTANASAQAARARVTAMARSRAMANRAATMRNVGYRGPTSRGGGQMGGGNGGGGAGHHGGGHGGGGHGGSHRR